MLVAMMSITSAMPMYDVSVLSMQPRPLDEFFKNAIGRELRRPQRFGCDVRGQLRRQRRQQLGGAAAVETPQFGVDRADHDAGLGALRIPLDHQAAVACFITHNTRRTPGAI